MLGSRLDLRPNLTVMTQTRERKTLLGANDDQPKAQAQGDRA